MKARTMEMQTADKATVQDFEQRLAMFAGQETESPLGEVRLTDTSNAEVLAKLYPGSIKFDHRRRRWLIWNEHHWEPDRDGQIYRLAIQVARIRYQQAELIHDLKERQRVAKWAIDSESRMRTEACIALARNVDMIADPGDDWDNNVWTLGVNNGVVDLKTGELTKGEPWDRITMTTGLNFDPDAECPRWQQFLTEVFDDPELIDWLHRALGYSLTGDTSEQCIFMGHGIGSNGKGVFCAAIHAAMGDYAYSSPFSTFELYQRANIPNDVAALEHKRFVNSSETNDNTRLNEARIKAMSGCDPITARYLHQEFFTFWPHLKLWLFVNHKPKVADDSLGFWRRVRLIPFTKQFNGDTDDKNLRDKLRAEAPGILTWLVQGCLKWQERGLDPIPGCVKAATEEYRVESDPVTQFLSEMSVDRPGATVKANELYIAYKAWAETQGMTTKEILTSTAFGRRMGDKYAKAKKGGGVYYYGVGLAGQFQDSFNRNVTENDVFPLYNSHKGKSRENYPKPSNCPDGVIGARCYKANGRCLIRFSNETEFSCIHSPEDCPYFREEIPGRGEKIPVSVASQTERAVTRST